MSAQWYLTVVACTVECSVSRAGQAPFKQTLTKGLTKLHHTTHTGKPTSHIPTSIMPAQPKIAPSTPAAAAAPPAAAAAAAVTDDGKWKKDFRTVDLTIASVMGTAFLFLATVDYSFDQYIWNRISAADCNVNNPLIQSIAIYYEWRLGGTPFLKYFELLVACLVPLILINLLKDNFFTIRGVRAPIGRHILDAEALCQIMAVIFITAAKAKPTAQKVVDLVNNGLKAGATTTPDVALHAELTNLLNYHFLIFMLNALQWFVPFLRLIYQRKQDATRAREASLAAAKATAAAAAADRSAARAAKASIPSEDEMRARMEAAEKAANGASAEEDENNAPAPAEMKKRNVPSKKK